MRHISFKDTRTPSIQRLCLAFCLAASISPAMAAEPCHPPAGLVAWWTLDEDASDRIGNHDGTPVGSPSAVNGKVNLALHFSQARIEIPAAPQLDVGLGQGFTLELWIKPDTLGAQALAGWNNGGLDVPSLGVHLWMNAFGGLFANVRTTTGSNRIFESSPNILTTETFQHVALTYDKNSGWGRLYLNGAEVGADHLGSFTPQTSFPFYIAARPVSNPAYPFNGTLDEVSVYNRTLSTPEILAIHNAGADGKCNRLTLTQEPADLTLVEGSDAAFTVTATGTGPISYQWFLDLAPIPDATSPTLELLNAQQEQSGGYHVIAANDSESVTSRVATLTVTEFVPVSITSHPKNVTALEGNNARFSVSVIGSAPLNYQWRAQDIDIPGATGPSLLFESVRFADAQDYSVVVANVSASATSTVARLTVNPRPPTLTSQPLDQSVIAGASVAFSVTANGSEPLQYQWLFNGNNLPDAIGPLLEINNAQQENAGTYSIRVSNAAGTIESPPASLTVNPAPPCSPPASGIVAWWPLEADGEDALGSHPGTLIGSPSPVNGQVNLALHFNQARIEIPAAPQLDVGLGQGFTLELWIKPDTLSAQALAGWNNSGLDVPSLGVHLWMNAFGGLFANVRTTTGSNRIFESSPNILTTETFQHVALTYNNHSGWGRLYLNGAEVGADNLGSFTPQTSFPFYIAARPVSNPAYPFNGTLDEVSLYDHALSTEELQAIHAAGPSGKCSQVTPPSILSHPQSITVIEGNTARFSVSANGTGPLAFQWLFNGSELTNETANTLELTDVNAADAGQYSVSVSNALGSTTSASATLTVDPGPVILTQPRSQVAQQGNDVTFRVTAAGQGPLLYNWFLDGIPLPNQTNTELVLLNVQLSQSGNYSVIVNNDVASIESQPAHLDVHDGASGGGTINFSNIGSGRVLDADGTPVPPGNTFLVQLYYGSSSENLSPAGSPALFLAPGIFVAGTQTLPTVPPGGSTLLSAHAWESALGATYEEALAQGGKTGRTPAALFTTGGRGIPPTPPGSYNMPDLTLQPGLPQPPVITQHPSPLTIPSGATASFSVSATGFGTLNYQWQFNGIDIPGANGPSLTLDAAIQADAGDYSVLVDNRGGTVASLPATLEVNLERILELVLPTQINEGDLLTFPVRLTSPGDVAAATFILHYDPDYFSLPTVSWDPGLQNSLKEVNTGQLGQIRFVFASASSSIPSGNQQLAQVSLRARSLDTDRLQELNLQLIDLADLAGNLIEFGSEARSGSVQILAGSTPGDNNGNAILDIGDATLLLRLLAGLDTVRPWDTVRNDLNGNNRLDSGDAVRLLATLEIGGAGGGQATLAAAPGSERIVITPDRLTGSAGQTITVQLLLQNFSTRIAGTAVTLHYPPSALRLTDSGSHLAGPAIPGNALSLWSVAPDNNYANQSGQITLAASSPTLWASANGVLAELTFVVQPQAASQYFWPITISSAQVTEDGYELRSLPSSPAAFLGRPTLPATLNITIGPEGETRLLILGEPGARHTLQVSGDLSLWEPMGELLDSGSLITDPDAASHNQRFYRLLSW